MGRAKRFGHAQFHKGKMKGDGPEIDTAQTPKLLDGRLALLEKIRKTFTDSIPNKTTDLYTKSNSDINSKNDSYNGKSKTFG